MEKFKKLIGQEMSVLELSNELQKLNCEDVGYFGNMSEILESGSMIVATNEDGSEHVKIDFNAIIIADDNESILASMIKIIDISEF